MDHVEPTGDERAFRVVLRGVFVVFEELQVLVRVRVSVRVRVRLRLQRTPPEQHALSPLYLVEPEYYGSTHCRCWTSTPNPNPNPNQARVSLEGAEGERARTGATLDL